MHWKSQIEFKGNYFVASISTNINTTTRRLLINLLIQSIES